MNILCKVFGHQPPVYVKKGWYAPGEEYGKEVIPCGIDGIGRGHARVEAECVRCNELFTVAHIHVNV